MKTTRKILSMILTLCILFTSVEMSAFAASESSGGTVTRAEWLEALADAFEMSVDSDNYVDNYYSDLNSDSPYYHTVMLATEFGLVDVEAGGEFLPEEADTDEAFTEMDVEGSLDGDLAQIQPVGEDVIMEYLAGGTEEANWEDSQVLEQTEELEKELQTGESELSAIRITKSYAIPENVRAAFNLGSGVSANITCTISKPTAKYSFKLGGESYFTLNARVSFTCNVSMDVLKAIGVDNSIQLAYVPVAYIGYMKATLELQLEGNINLNITEQVSVGVRYHKNSGFSLISQLQKESFSLVARVQAKAGISLTAGVNVSVLKASLYGKIGVQGNATFSAYPDDSKTCLHVTAWMYASLGCNASLDFPGSFLDKSWGKSVTIYNEKNSPFKISFHYENGKPVARCTKEGCITTTGKVQKVSYYTLYPSEQPLRLQWRQLGL